MSMVALSTRSVTHSLSSPHSLKKGIWKEPGVIPDAKSGGRTLGGIPAPTSFRMVVGDASSSTGPLGSAMAKLRVMLRGRR